MTPSRVPQLRDVLARRACPSDIAVGEPSIEDVFVALLEKGNAP